MKKSRKFLKVLSVSAIAAMMAAATVPMTAFAADGDVTVTLNPATKVVQNTNGSGTTSNNISTAFSIYTVFTATPTSAGASTYNYEVDGDFKNVKVAVLDDGNNPVELDFSSEDIAADIAKYCDGEARNKSANIKKVANALQATKPTTADITKDAASTTQTQALQPGYYLIVPTATDAQMVIAPTLLSVTTTAEEVTPKTSSISIDKSIEKVLKADGTEISGVVSGTGETATVGKDEVVSYSIKSTVPSYAADVTALTNDYTITDTPCDALDIIYDVDNGEGDIDVFDGITVKVNNVPVSKSDDTYKIEKGTGGKGFVVTFADSYVLANGGKEVVITFDAKVINDKLDVSTTGNTNTASYSFDNDYQDGDGAPVGDSDTVIVFTTKLDVTKEFYDGATQLNNVTGAKFILYKDYINESNPGTKIGEYEIEVASENEFTFGKLTAGTYTLVEDTAPTGYTKIDNITFTVTANTDSESDEYDGTYTFTDTNTGDGKITFTPDTDNVSASTTIINKKGQTLPGTGGMGTTIFTIAGLGTIVVAGAALTIYMKKRRTEEE